jgi:hypothetical protein
LHQIRLCYFPVYQEVALWKRKLTAFTSERITAFAVSRDRKRLALARGTTSSDVVLIRDLK